VVSKSTGTPMGGIVIFPLRDRKGGVKDEFASWSELFGADPYSTLSSSDEAAATSRDGDGSFTLGPLPPGNYTVLFTFPSAPLAEFRELLKVPLHVTEGKTPEPLTAKIIVKKPMYKLKGRVMDGRTKTPVADEMIAINVQSHYAPDDSTYVEHWYIWEPVTHHVKTNRNGEFTLYPLDHGKLVFDVSWNGLSVEKRVAVPPVGKTIDFVVQPLPPKPASAYPTQQKKR
jgi:hypothetical protein